ncbi:MAG: Gfo/Idh/MocA family oxidoreductase [Lentisphaerae bacterium]|nr:Gfo/Idh/MocA family oxidoreductase [Lentisphaerota bacterium]
MSKVKLGIIGFGRLGMRHASNIHQRIDFAELTAVCSVVQEELDRAVEAFHPKFSTADFKELLEDKNLDGVVIASNTVFHVSMAIDALKVGVKNICLEKPISMTKKEINDLKEAIDHYGVNIFQLGYNRRMGVFEVTRNSVAGFDCEMEVYGTEGYVQMGFPPSKNRVISFTPDGLRIECADDFYDYFEPSFPAEIQHFAECIRDNNKPIVNFEDGYKAVEWALLATEAVRNNEKLVFD